MQLILRAGDTDNLAPSQMLKINIWICRDEIQRADIESIHDSVKRIPRPDSVAERIWTTTIDWYEDKCPRHQTSRIDPWVYLQDAFFADIEFSGYSAYSITLFD